MKLLVVGLELEAEKWWRKKSPADRAVILQAVWEIETGQQSPSHPVLATAGCTGPIDVAPRR